MTEQRPDHVMALANAALDGMKSAMTPETTAVELLSAQLTILARFVQVLREMGVDEKALRDGIDQIVAPRTLLPMSKRVH